jgi:hypothetical protein
MLVNSGTMSVSKLTVMAPCPPESLAAASPHVDRPSLRS